MMRLFMQGGQGKIIELWLNSRLDTVSQYLPRHRARKYAG